MRIILPGGTDSTRSSDDLGQDAPFSLNVNFSGYPFVFLCVSPTSAQLPYSGNLLPSRGRGLFFKHGKTKTRRKRAREKLLSVTPCQPRLCLPTSAVHAAKTPTSRVSTSSGPGKHADTDSHACRAAGTVQYFLRSSLTKPIVFHR